MKEFNGTIHWDINWEQKSGKSCKFTNIKNKQITEKGFKDNQIFS